MKKIILMLALVPALSLCNAQTRGQQADRRQVVRTEPVIDSIGSPQPVGLYDTIASGPVLINYNGHFQDKYGTQLETQGTEGDYLYFKFTPTKSECATYYEGYAEPVSEKVLKYQADKDDLACTLTFTYIGSDKIVITATGCSDALGRCGSPAGTYNRK